MAGTTSYSQCTHPNSDMYHCEMLPCLPHSRPPEYSHFTVETGKTVYTFATQCTYLGVHTIGVQYIVTFIVKYHVETTFPYFIKVPKTSNFQKATCNVGAKNLGGHTRRHM